MRETRVADVDEWMRSLDGLKRNGTCRSPGFFKPFHFVSVALMLKEVGANALGLPPDLVPYAARMKLWEAIGLDCPVTVAARPSKSRFHEVTPLIDLAKVESVASDLADMMAEGEASPCDAESHSSLYIMLTELLSNCHHHARTEDQLHGLVCGQTWYGGHRAQIAIADSGIGIRQSLAENPDLERRLRESNACNLAMRLGISSKLNQGHAGYGLAVAKDLALQTRGALLMVQSGAERALVRNGAITEQSDIKCPLPGTLVLFEWDLRQPLDVTRVYSGWPKAEDDDGFF